MDKDKRSQSSPLLLEEWAWYEELAKVELAVCRDYSFGRLAVRLERIYRGQQGLTRFDPERWLEDRTMSIRHAWRIQGFVATVRENPIWFTYPPTRTLVIYPEWPNSSYLKIDPAQRLRRIEHFGAALSDDEKRAEGQYLLEAGNPNKPDKPVPPTLAKRLTELAWLLDPSNYSTGKKRIIEVAIPENQGHEALLEAFRALLKTEFPQQGKPYRKSPGRGSEEARIVDDLNALAVYWLRQIAKLRRADILPLVKHPLTGAQVYGDEKKLDEPLRRIAGQRRGEREPCLQKFARDCFGNLTPLEPLSDPDFSLL